LELPQGATASAFETIIAVHPGAPVAGAASEPLQYTFTETCTLGAISVCSGSAAGD
jgi:hypothetical protein